jgi:hypothetical protein
MVGRHYQPAIPPVCYVTADEIAAAVLFLCSVRAAAIVAVHHAVGGGRTTTDNAVTQAIERCAWGVEASRTLHFDKIRQIGVGQPGCPRPVTHAFCTQRLFPRVKLML